MTRRPFHHESEETRRQDLIAATLDAIAESGLKGATVREIAERAGVTPGLIRHYFVSKELMFQAAYRAVMMTMFETADQAAEEEGSDALSRLRVFVLANFKPPIIDPRNLSLWATFISQISVDPALAAIHREGYLAFLGRISPEKRPDRAIAIAQRLGMRLKIAAKVDAADRAYFHERIEPLILAEPLVEFVGEIGDDQKSDFLGGADALLFPIDWPEPFGLVMIEAMACGTPVIAYGCGSVPEVIDDGQTGFIVSSDDEALAAISRIPSLNRREVRRRFDERFSSVAMAQRYLDLYARLAGARPELGVALAANA